MERQLILPNHPTLTRRQFLRYASELAAATGLAFAFPKVERIVNHRYLTDALKERAYANIGRELDFEVFRQIPIDGIPVWPEKYVPTIEERLRDAMRSLTQDNMFGPLRVWTEGHLVLVINMDSETVRQKSGGNGSFGLFQVENVDTSYLRALVFHVSALVNGFSDLAFHEWGHAIWDHVGNTLPLSWREGLVNLFPAISHYTGDYNSPYILSEADFKRYNQPEARGWDLIHGGDFVRSTARALATTTLFQMHNKRHSLFAELSELEEGFVEKNGMRPDFAQLLGLGEKIQRGFTRQILANHIFYNPQGWGDGLHGCAGC